MKNINKWLCILSATLLTTITMAAETPLCALPQASSTAHENDANADCAPIIKNAEKTADTSKLKYSFENNTLLPPQLTVGAVYLQPITMSPEGMMLPRNQSDIHLEMDIHAKGNLKARGFAPGDWLPNAKINYTIQKVGDPQPLICGGMHSTTSKYSCELMPMVASDGAHYGDNVKLNGPGFYIVTFEAHTNPNFGWHTDTESKVLGTEFVDWHFTQRYLFKWTGIGKIGGY
jgi:uncharacterized protein involved in high-affinity Fe2+ transport